MNRWFLLDPQMFRAPAILRLSAREFRAEMAKALDGQDTAFDPFIRGPYTRPLSNEWAELRATVFERDNYTCTYCGADGVRLECDHVIPVSKGGGSDTGNLTTACKPCNRSKGARTVQEWKH